jgi:hypothetical protein
VSGTESAIVNPEEFMTRGWVRVRGGVPDEVLLRVRTAAPGIVPSEPAVPWRTASVPVYDLPLLARAPGPRVREAIDVLVGAGRWHLAAMWGFPTRFAGSIDPVWHIDGDWFHHHLLAGEQVLTPIFFWDSIGADDGPSLLWPGSHRIVARLLASREPEGIAGSAIASVVHEHLSRASPSPEPATGEAGDVILCHPLLAHAINPNGSVRPRYLSNVAVHAFTDLNLDETRRTLSPVEVAIVRALSEPAADPPAFTT